MRITELHIIINVKNLINLEVYLGVIHRYLNWELYFVMLERLIEVNEAL